MDVCQRESMMECPEMHAVALSTRLCSSTNVYGKIIIKIMCFHSYCTIIIIHAQNLMQDQEAKNLIDALVSCCTKLS